MTFLILIIYLMKIVCIRSQTVTITATPNPIASGNRLILKCIYNGSETETGVNWFEIGDPQGVLYGEDTANPTNCTYAFGGSAYNLSRFSTTCDAAQNIYTLSFTVLSSDINKSWCCTYLVSTSTNCLQNVLIMEAANTTSSSTPEPIPTFILAIIFFFQIVMAVFLIFFCCGCLDCCQCCRLFDHYDESECLYVTWYFINRGCCSFFYCTSGSKRRRCWFGINKREYCEGCLSCRRKCTCGWPGNCKSMTCTCCGCCFCLCCVTPRRVEEDPLIVCIDNKDELSRPFVGERTITCSVHGYGPDHIKVTWTGPQRKTLANSTKYKITPYNMDTGKCSLTISPFSSSDNGQYTCQVKDRDGFSVKDSIIITVHANENETNRTGPPVIHIGTQNKVETKTTSRETSDRSQTLPMVAIVTEDVPKYRREPLPPENSYIKNPKRHGSYPNFDDKQGLPSRPSRLPPLTHKKPAVEEEDCNEITMFGISGFATKRY